MGFVFLESPDPFEALPVTLFIAFAFLSGVAVGGIGVGGVGLTPGLMLISITAKAGMKIVLASFLIPGLVAIYMWRKHIAVLHSVFVAAGIAPSAILAALLLRTAPQNVFPPIIGSLALISSLRVFVPMLPCLRKVEECDVSISSEHSSDFEESLMIEDASPGSDVNLSVMNQDLNGRVRARSRSRTVSVESQAAAAVQPAKERKENSKMRIFTQFHVLLVGLGVITGAGSVVSGTGGPFILLPLPIFTP